MLTPVKQGFALHPSEYNWSGYTEATGIRKRYRIFNKEILAEIYQTTEQKVSEGVFAAVDSCRHLTAPIEEWEANTAIGTLEWTEQIALTITHSGKRKSINFLEGYENLYGLKTPVNDRRYYINKLINRYGALAGRCH